VGYRDAFHADRKLLCDVRLEICVVFTEVCIVHDSGLMIPLCQGNL